MSWTGIFRANEKQVIVEKGLIVDVLRANIPRETEVPQIYCSRRKLEQIFTTATDAALDEFYPYFYNHANDFKIREEVQENFFLAQVKAEVGTDLESVRENLNYSCSALKSTFSYYDRNPSEADVDGRCNGHDADQVNIGNKAYANRIGNGSVSSGDGYRFRGGGFFQLTGRGNYQASAVLINSMLDMGLTAEDFADKITEVDFGLLGAMSFWFLNDMDKCKTIHNCTAVINKHTDSYQKRYDYYIEIAAIPPGGYA